MFKPNREITHIWIFASYFSFVTSQLASRIYASWHEKSWLTEGSGFGVKSGWDNGVQVAVGRDKRRGERKTETKTVTNKELKPKKLPKNWSTVNILKQFGESLKTARVGNVCEAGNRANMFNKVLKQKVRYVVCNWREWISKESQCYRSRQAGCYQKLSEFSLTCQRETVRRGEGFNVQYQQHALHAPGLNWPIKGTLKEKTMKRTRYLT